MSPGAGVKMGQRYILCGDWGEGLLGQLGLPEGPFCPFLGIFHGLRHFSGFDLWLWR